MTSRQKREDLEYGAIVGKLLERIGYSHDAVIADGNLLVKNGLAYDSVMLKPGKHIMAHNLKDAAEKIAKHLSDGKQMFIDKVSTKDTEGVAEFLIEMSLGV